MSNEESKTKTDSNIEQQNIDKKDQTPEEIVTISPTMMDEEELTKTEHHQDVSAIIPQFVTTKTEEQISLESKDTQLKSDGSVVIGNIVDDVYNYIPNTELPQMIDVKARKQFLKKNKDKKMNIAEVDLNAEKQKQKKFLNITSTMSLVIIIGLVLFYFYYKSVPKDSDFKALPVTVELGDALPSSKSAYVKPGIGTTVDELAYTIDTSNVVVDKVGQYNYSVRHNGITKQGILEIVDTTAPEIETREVVITQGETYDASSFVVKCSDLSGCNYTFEESNTETKYTEAGSYTVVVAATDAYGNKSIKQESLIIEQLGYVKYFVKNHEYDFNTKSQRTEKYEIHFTDFQSTAVILTGVYTEITTYSDSEAYQKARSEYYGEANYTCDDEAKTITHIEKANTVGYLYSEYPEVMNWFESEGFTETSE